MAIYEAPGGFWWFGRALEVRCSVCWPHFHIPHTSYARFHSEPTSYLRAPHGRSPSRFISPCRAFERSLRTPLFHPLPFFSYSHFCLASATGRLIDVNLGRHHFVSLYTLHTNTIPAPSLLSQTSSAPLQPNPRSRSWLFRRYMYLASPGVVLYLSHASTS